MQEVIKAEMKKPETKRVSSAPQPINAASGTTRTQKSVNDMSGDEILKKYNINF